MYALSYSLKTFFTQCFYPSYFIFYYFIFYYYYYYYLLSHPHSKGFSETTLPEIEGVNLDDELLDALKNPLVDVSRQRLRAIQISFRRLGNLENQITAKELNSVLTDHNIKMPVRTFQLILKKFEGKYGVDFEPLWKFMVQAQSRTGKFEFDFQVGFGEWRLAR